MMTTMIKLMMMMTTMMKKLMKNDLDLTFKLTVHSSRGFSKLLIQTLSAALVSRDCPIPGWQIQMSNDDDNYKLLLLLLMMNMDTVIVCISHVNHMYTTCFECTMMIT